MKIYVAVKKEIREVRENLKWLLQEKMLWELQRNSPERLKIIITHIYVPSDKKPFGHIQKGMEIAEKCLEEHLTMCLTQKVDTELLVHTAENVVKGLVELIDLYQISKLVMGAASDQRYRKNMNIPTSRTACNVSLFAERSCDIWFLCKGNFVSRRERLFYISQMPAKTLLKCQSEVLSSKANPLNLDISLLASLLASKYLSKEQDEPSIDKNDINKADYRFIGHENTIYFTSSSKELGYGSDNEQSNKLAQALAEVKNLKEKLHCESQRNQKLEEDTNAALIKVSEFEKKYHHAVKEMNCQKEKLASLSNISALQNFIEFSSAEIEQATNNYKNKIGEGGFGSVYKGLLRNTMVAVKILNPESLQGIKEFHHEVAILGKVRHPNIVTLMGACSEACTVVYEFLPNGNLAQRLICKKPPLSWQDRIRIADNICSALTFLHSSKPHPIVHGDLKPENILLDANLVSKLGDFGLCRLLEQSSAAGTTVFHLSEKLSGTRPYMDPELFQSGEVTKLCDIYSFGVVILQLATGKGPVGIIDAVRKAASAYQFHAIMDKDAGDWPSQHASNLVLLGLKCCNPDGKKRPLLTEVARAIKDMRVNLL